MIEDQSSSEFFDFIRGWILMVLAHVVAFVAVAVICWTAWGKETVKFGAGAVGLVLFFSILFMFRRADHAKIESAMHLGADTAVSSLDSGLSASAAMFKSIQTANVEMQRAMREQQKAFVELQVQNAKTLGKAHRMELDERKLLATRQRKEEEANAEEAEWHYRSKQMQLPDDIAPDAPGDADYKMPGGF